MPARIKWSDEDLAEVRRLRLCHLTNAEIGARFGVSSGTISRLVSERKLLTPEKIREIQSDKLRDRKASEATLKRMAKASRQVWKRPGYRARVSAHLRSLVPSDERREALKQKHDEKRGFDVPDHLRAEYEFLRKTKVLTAREAGEVLGLVAPAGGLEARAA